MREANHRSAAVEGGTHVDELPLRNLRKLKRFCSFSALKFSQFFNQKDGLILDIT
jgi:hypothetical protein